VYFISNLISPRFTDRIPNTEVYSSLESIAFLPRTLPLYFFYAVENGTDVEYATDLTNLYNYTFRIARDYSFWPGDYYVSETFISNEIGRGLVYQTFFFFLFVLFCFSFFFFCINENNSSCHYIFPFVASFTTQALHLPT